MKRDASSRALRAFTLVEIMVVVVIIGILATLALPAFKRMRERSIASRYVNDFRQFESAFQRYNLENGGWPAAGAAGTVPPGMAPYLPGTYTAASPMGGNYSWSGPSGTTGLIRLTGSNATDAVMQYVDASLDNGDLATGDFGKIAAGYHYRLH